MGERHELEALDLAALLCSRVCHDIISPVGAVINGLEVLDEDNSEDMRTFAFDLIRRSAAQASATTIWLWISAACRSCGASVFRWSTMSLTVFSGPVVWERAPAVIRSL